MKPRHGPPFILNPQQPSVFPPVNQAMLEPNGLLAIGGDLSLPRLLAAYRHGIFPWFNEDQPILWWTPDPRAVLFPASLKISRSLRKRLRQQPFRITLDTAFADVIQGCAAARKKSHGTWITTAMQTAYIQLHEAGYAHSVEVWQDELLVGGLYGVSLGKVFFGESMFSRSNDASKIALVYLVYQLQRWAFDLIDCQVESAHLNSLGAIPVSRHDFMVRLDKAMQAPTRQGIWRCDPDLTEAILHS